MEEMAYIYIMTNKSFEGHNWVKIGYATNPEQRRKELYNTSVPYQYEIYATYQVPKSTHLADKTLHSLVSDLNPDLRLSDNREFFEMTPEAAYQILEKIAQITGTEDRLKRYVQPIVQKQVISGKSSEQNELPFSRENIATKILDYLNNREDAIVLTNGNVYQRWTTPTMRKKVGLIGSGTWSGIQDLLAYEIKVFDRGHIFIALYIGPGEKEDRDAWLDFALNNKPPFIIKGSTTSHGNWKRIYKYELCDANNCQSEAQVIEETLSNLNEWFNNELPQLDSAFNKKI